MTKPKYTYGMLLAAKKHSVHNWDEIIRSTISGCYHCETIFLSNDICEWTDRDEKKPYEATALCPFCGMDSVLAQSSAYPLKKDFLQQMRRYWFKEEDQNGYNKK